MRGRTPAEAHQLHRGRWVFAYDVPWLPDLLAGTVGARIGEPVGEAFGGQIAFLRGIAAGAPVDSALQLRFVADPERDRLACQLVGAAATERDASLLSRIVATTMPADYPLEHQSPSDVPATVRVVDPDRLLVENVVEIRRGIGQLDPSLNASRDAEPVMFPWSWSRQAMLAALGLVQQQPARTVMVVHIEPDVMPSYVAGFLQDEIDRMARDAADGEGQAITVPVIRAYQRWLRVLVTDALSLRFLLASEGPLIPGLAESISTDLTRTFEKGQDVVFGPAEVVVPHAPSDLDACAVMLDELRGVGWRLPARREVARLLHLFDPLEANTAFRLPVTPRGGLPGVASQRPETLGAGAELREHGERVVRFGRTANGATYGLSLEDLNRHVLVAGLPGFGKSSTVQLLLERMHLDFAVPFLVIDPAKGDYGGLFDRLGVDGDVGVYRLRPEDVAFNPLAVPEGVSPGTHAGRLLAAFDSAMGLSDAWPLAYVVLQRAVYQLYDRVREGGPNPTFAELYRVTGDQIRRSPFHGEARANLQGSLLGRLEVLATATLGRALSGGPKDAIPWGRLLRRPTLIELGAFAGPAERSLLFGLLIAGLVSYREAHPEAGLGHVTVLEEAHRVLRGGGPPDAGVEVFVDAIAELRGAGEGFIIVDQTPSLLHPAVLKLTGSKLVHRLVEREERTIVGASMVLDPAQAEDLARLARQRLVAYAATASAATLVDVDGLEGHRPATADPPSRVPVESALATDPEEARLRCVGCPVMCDGTAGLVKLPELVASLGDSDFRADDLVAEAYRLTVASADAYCLTAEYITARFGRWPATAADLRRRTQTFFAKTERLRRSRPDTT